VDSLDVGGGGGGGNAGPDYELRHFDIRPGSEEGKEDPGDTDTLLLRDSSSSPAHPTRHKSASESAQSDFTTSGFGGSSQGGCTTATLSSEGGRLQPPPPSEVGSSVSGYISMMGRTDSGQSNYTQLGQGRARTLSGHAQRAMSGGPSDRSSYPQGRPSPASSPHLTTPEEEEAAATPGSGPAEDQPQLSLCEWNSFPGYSIVRTGGEPAPPPPERRMNGYVPALPSIPPTSMGGTQVLPLYTEFSIAHRCTFVSFSTSVRYCSYSDPE